jgi:hypothetical protein
MDNRPSITDSPWFWVMLFSLMAIGALLSVGGKYGRRQAGIERQYQARERVMEGQGSATELSPRPYATADDTLIPLWPLAAALGGLAALAVVMLVRGRLRPDSPADGGAPP